MGKISGLIIGILLFTTAISAGVGIATSLGFNLTAVEIQQGEAEQTRGEYMTDKLTDINKLSFSQRLLEVIPSNPFADMARSRSSSTLAVVIFSAFIGVAAFGIKKKQAEQFETFGDAVLKVLVHFYSCIGGTPYYLAQIDQSESFEANIKRLYFDILGYLVGWPSYRR